MNRDAEFPLPERTPENPFGAIVEDRVSQRMKITTFVEYFHTLHEANMFYPYDPYFDCFMLFHPGLGHPASSQEWEKTLPQLLETKVPVICTGYTEWDMNRDWKWVMEKCAGEVDLLMEPGENRFRSLRWDLNDLDPQDISCGNWGVWAFRGKRYVHFWLCHDEINLLTLHSTGTKRPARTRHNFNANTSSISVSLPSRVYVKDFQHHNSFEYALPSPCIFDYSPVLGGAVRRSCCIQALAPSRTKCAVLGQSQLPEYQTVCSQAFAPASRAALAV